MCRVILLVVREESKKVEASIGADKGSGLDMEGLEPYDHKPKPRVNPPHSSQAIMDTPSNGYQKGVL